MDLSFVKCTMDDLNDLQYISKITFSDAFEEKNNPQDFEEYMDYSFSKQKLTFELLNPNSEFFFVFLDKELVGYFKMNYNDAQTEHFEHNAIELERFYVLKNKQGKGIGADMMQFVLNKAKNRKALFMWLGVWQENEAAVRFYERYGFEKFDTHPYFIGTDQQTDWLMKLNLA